MSSFARNQRRVLAKRARQARRGSEGGFTLVELLVAMVAGLIVALAVVGLSREASNTFHEESRIASAEMQIRSAIDRIRADVQRAAFMSTGNIYIDPQILTTPGTTANVASINNSVFPDATTGMSLYTLAGLRLWPGGSVTPPGGSVPSTPGLVELQKLSTVNFPNPAPGPDALDIAGNMTGVEVLQMGGVTGQPAIVNNGGCGGQGQRVYLNVQSSPALWRLVGLSPTGTDAAYGAALVNAFQPVTGSSFVVRVMDNTTHKTQYAATCASWPASGVNPWNVTASVPQPYVDLDPNTPINLPGVSINATINPVQIVRWKIQPSLVNAGAVDTTKFDLTRQWLDAKGALAGNPEVVAEYAVDLKFAFTIDDCTTDNTGNYAGGCTTPPIIVNAFEDSSNASATTNAVVAGDIASASPGLPQRIRSVRIRLVTRAPQQDRAEPLAVAGSANDYLYRYCLVENALTCAQAGAPVFARTRTLISEVSLPNQARFWYP